MRIDRRTIVEQALRSSPEAPGLFERHGVTPHLECVSVKENIDMETAAQWCGIEDLDALIEELNQALVGEPVSKGTG